MCLQCHHVNSVSRFDTAYPPDHKMIISYHTILVLSMHSPEFTNVGQDTTNTRVVNIASSVTSDVTICQYEQQFLILASSVAIVVDIQLAPAPIIMTQIRVSHINFMIISQNDSHICHKQASSTSSPQMSLHLP